MKSDIRLALDLIADVNKGDGTLSFNMLVESFQEARSAVVAENGRLWAALRRISNIGEAEEDEDLDEEELFAKCIDIATDACLAQKEEPSDDLSG